MCQGGFEKKKKGFHLPKYNPCKTMGEDLTCIMKCKAQKLRYHGKAAKKKVTMEVWVHL